MCTAGSAVALDLTLTRGAGLGPLPSPWMLPTSPLSKSFLFFLSILLLEASWILHQTSSSNSCRLMWGEVSSLGHGPPLLLWHWPLRTNPWRPAWRQLPRMHDSAHRWPPSLPSPQSLKFFSARVTLDILGERMCSGKSCTEQPWLRVAWPWQLKV